MALFGSFRGTSLSLSLSLSLYLSLAFFAPAPLGNKAFHVPGECENDGADEDDGGGGKCLLFHETGLS